MHHTNVMPRDHICIDEGPVGLNPFGESRATLVLVNVSARSCN
ncbi:MAG: hypothetical protein CM1200mP20_04390 [Pseudomonadota bacterium]|nr:MAG: hypothetical protein CM1200mP20_04390 [Pseudomonadota bacterium]